MTEMMMNDTIIVSSLKSFTCLAEHQHRDTSVIKQEQ